MNAVYWMIFREARDRHTYQERTAPDHEYDGVLGARSGEALCAGYVRAAMLSAASEGMSRAVNVLFKTKYLQSATIRLAEVQRDMSLDLVFVPARCKVIINPSAEIHWLNVSLYESSELAMHDVNDAALRLRTGS